MRVSLWDSSNQQTRMLTDHTELVEIHRQLAKFLKACDTTCPSEIEYACGCLMVSTVPGGIETGDYVQIDLQGIVDDLASMVE